ncbi:D-glycero-alpha-D-manno-heptose-1,7-bisphosphate 7-phosphatase [Asticcacaulis benevestitus]|uniref:D,D-heptose 1,7-bisphosphate phosphatase n=1 Tax=Asticcacaulis benevestitus DSM 16100 = ATCC BAA-896 TaxID=1121022 RepID=V4PE74_9CAUL|nr:HAD family hydrolase [Asticcacaulis benevestitus]ESQ85454.1 hypothetical protein ABENE_18840 [Asticcacaulis benevestitus DSM 16100 = ATCC BAA-896]
MSERQRCAFLDRDGTLIEERNYLSDPNQAVLLPGVAQGLKALSAQGFRLIVLTNQSGIGRGYFTETAALSVNQRIDDMLRIQGIDIAAFYLCPHAPEALCHCRKPMPGLVEQASSAFMIDLPTSIMIGDKDTDLLLAANLGMRGFLVSSGHADTHLPWALSQGFEVFPDIASIARSLDNGVT